MIHLEGLSDDALFDLLQKGLNVLRERKRARTEEPIDESNGFIGCYLKPNPLGIPETEFKAMIAATYRILGDQAHLLASRPMFNTSTNRIELIFQTQAAFTSARACLKLRGQPYELVQFEKA